MAWLNNGNSSSSSATKSSKTKFSKASCDRVVCRWLTRHDLPSRRTWVQKNFFRARRPGPCQSICRALPYRLLCMATAILSCVVTPCVLPGVFPGVTSRLCLMHDLEWGVDGGLFISLGVSGDTTISWTSTHSSSMISFAHKLFHTPHITTPF